MNWVILSLRLYVYESFVEAKLGVSHPKTICWYRKTYYENHSVFSARKKIEYIPQHHTPIFIYIKGVCFVTMKIKDIVMVCCYRVEEDMKIAGSCHFHVSNDKIWSFFFYFMRHSFQFQCCSFISFWWCLLENGKNEVKWNVGVCMAFDCLGYFFYPLFVPYIVLLLFCLKKRTFCWRDACGILM